MTTTMNAPTTGLTASERRALAEQERRVALAEFRRDNPFKLTPPELRPEQPKDNDRGRAVVWDVFDPDGTLVASGFKELAEAMERRRVIPGRFIQTRLHPFNP